MNKPSTTPKNTEKKAEELKTEPMSEKDEVKAAERRMAKTLKTAKKTDTNK